LHSIGFMWSDITCRAARMLYCRGERVLWYQ
jgi:hypothetical protein